MKKTLKTAREIASALDKSVAWVNSLLKDETFPDDMSRSYACLAIPMSVLASDLRNGHEKPKPVPWDTGEIWVSGMNVLRVYDRAPKQKVKSNHGRHTGN